MADQFQPNRSRAVPWVVGIVALLVVSILFVGFILLVTAPRAGFGQRSDGFVTRALPEVPAEAPQADQYQPFLAPADGQDLHFQLLDDPEVLVQSVEPIGVAVGPFGDREFYRYKARMEPGGGFLACIGEFGANSGSSSCGDDADGARPGVGGGSSQSGNGPIIEYASVEGLGDDAAWALFELGSGFSIVSEVRHGITSAEWVGDSDGLVVVTVYSADLDELWSGG